MLKVMIVDDEPKVRDGLKTIIDWNEYGYCICGESSDGVEGLCVVKEQNPDLILVDIRMPEMDGLEFIKQVKTLGCRSKFIILTGYSDFEYTKKAIQIGVNSYLLKPVEEDELIITVREIYDTIVKEKEMMNFIDNGRKHLRNSTLKSIMKGCMEHEKSDIFIENAENTSSKSFQAVIIRVNSGDAYEDLDALIRETGFCFFKNSDNTLHIFEMDGRTCVVFEGKNTDRNMDILNNTLESAKQRLKTSLFIAVGRTVDEIRGLRQSYQDALEIMENSFYYDHKYIAVCSEPGNGLINNMQSTNEKCSFVMDIPLCIEKLFVAAEIGDVSKIESISSGLFSALETRKYQEIKLKGLCFNVLNEVYKKALEHYPLLKDSLPASEDMMTGIYDKENMCRLKSYFTSQLVLLAEYIAGADSQAVMKKVVNYVDVNYGMDLTLELLGNLFGYNSGYLGKAFRQFSGESFNDYLEKVRIENAKLLLQEGYRACDVAYKTGFKNMDYFYFKFKKHVGVSTTEYKKHL